MLLIPQTMVQLYYLLVVRSAIQRNKNRAKYSAIQSMHVNPTRVGYAIHNQRDRSSQETRFPLFGHQWFKVQRVGRSLVP